MKVNLKHSLIAGLVFGTTTLAYGSICNAQGIDSNPAPTGGAITGVPTVQPAPQSETISPQMQAANQRVETAKTNLDMARKRLNAAKALLKAADAEYKAAQADRIALSLSTQAQQMADASGLSATNDLTSISALNAQPAQQLANTGTQIPVNALAPATTTQTTTQSITTNTATTAPTPSAGDSESMIDFSATSAATGAGAPVNVQYSPTPEAGR